MIGDEMERNSNFFHYMVRWKCITRSSRVKTLIFLVLEYDFPITLKRSLRASTVFITTLIAKVGVNYVST